MWVHFLINYAIKLRKQIYTICYENANSPNIQIIQILITPYNPASTPLHHSHSRTVHMGGDHLQQFMYMEYRMSTVSS